MEQTLVDLVKTKAGDLVKVAQNSQVATSTAWGYRASLAEIVDPGATQGVDLADGWDRRYAARRARRHWRAALKAVLENLAGD